MPVSKRVAVVGAGVNGLSSAVKILETFQDGSVQVDLYADEVTPNTTGDGSAGLWGPYLCGSTSTEKIAQWSAEAHDYFLHLWRSGLAAKCGVSLQPMLRLTTEKGDHPEPYWKDIVFGCVQLTAVQLAKLSKEHGRQYTGGSHFVSFTCEPTRLLPYLFESFTRLGGRFEKCHVDNFDDLLACKGTFDLIVNCTGLGAKKLADDPEMKPVRGQVTRVYAPWIYQVILDESDDGHYIIPNVDSVILGGTHQENDYNCEVSQSDFKIISDGCNKMVPSLKNAPLIKNWVGLRPGRTSVRLEAQMFQTKTNVSVPIIHNYGHGGSGVTLAWGCASEVLQLAKKYLNI